VKIVDVELMFLLGERNKFLSVFPPLFVNLGDSHVPTSAFNLGDSHVPTSAFNLGDSHVPTSAFNLGDSHVPTSAFNSVQNFWASRKSAEGRPCSCYSRK